MNRTLFQISDDLLALDLRLDELGGDLSDPDVEQEIEAWFQTVSADRDQKVDNYAALIRELEARAEARKAEAKRLSERARLDTERAAFLKGRLQAFFERHGLKKLETPRFRLSIARHGGKLPLLVDLSPEELPDDFRREIVTVKANTTAIREFLDAGEALPFARYGERGQSLRIR